MTFDLHCALISVLEEYEAARKHFRVAHSAHEGFAILKEEVDELWEVVREKQSTPGRADRMRREATQVAAMAVAILVEIGGYDA